MSISLHTGGELRPLTSTDVDGRYAAFVPPDAVHRLSADLTGFTASTREIGTGPAPCDLALDFELTLAPRRREPVASQAGAPGSGSEQGAAPRPQGGDRGRAGSASASGRFEALTLQADAAALAAGAAPEGTEAAEIASLLPPGFTVEAAEADAVAVAGGAGAASVDRGQLNDRLQLIRRGDLDPGAGFQPGAAGVPPTLGGEGFGELGRGLGRGGRGGFVLGGRGLRGQRRYQGSFTYTFGGSALDAAPYQLRSDVAAAKPQFAANTIGATFGGPLRIPGLYANPEGRTNLQLNATVNQSNNVFDQYATVPTEAMRRGDFSASPVPLVDPATGRPFPNNQIPSGRIDPGSALLLSFIPLPNLSGTIQNYHVSTTTHSSSEAVSARVTHSFTAPVQGRGAGGFGRGFGGGVGRGAFGSGSPPRGTNVVLNAQVQYRRNTAEAPNVFPQLGSETTTTTVAVPVGLNIVKGRAIQNLAVNFAHSGIESSNAFSGVTNVAALAGIRYPPGASLDPLNYGVPNLVFSGFTGVQGPAATVRSDTRTTIGYTLIRRLARHTLRMGGDYRYDTSTSENNANARGTFTFTGLYTLGGAHVSGSTGADFADFLLGLPQQASLQVSGLTELRQHAFDGFFEDNWQKNAKLTFNLGLRYELARPYVEAQGRMANLDAAPGFTAVAPVVAGGAGPFTGSFPAGLINTDANNVGPRLGAAYRVARNTVLRGGYSITYNSASYASIARQLTGEPPFAEAETNTGTVAAPLTLAEALLGSTAATTNTWGVDRDYALGKIQTWNAALSRDFASNWTLVLSYTGIKGTDLDILRAPNRTPTGLSIPGVQPFIWESSGGHSIMNAGSVQLRRRLAGGLAGAVSYTLGKSMDNASSLGAGRPIVAQNDKDLASEWALSSFDRRQQVSANLSWELPFGASRRWLTGDGWVPLLAGGWTLQLAATLQSGTPYTARVLGATTDVARGTNGSLRGDYNGAPIQLANPTVDEYFNINAFSIPAPGLFGTAGRNTIIGPGVRQLDGVLTRDIRLSPSRTMTLQVNALNLLNTVQWASIDTSLNSPTFGHVVSVRPMRTVTITARFRY